MSKDGGPALGAPLHLVQVLIVVAHAEGGLMGELALPGALSSHFSNQAKPSMAKPRRGQKPGYLVIVIVAIATGSSGHDGSHIQEFNGICSHFSGNYMQGTWG